MSVPPFVSVITPFYNTHSYLVECIESVLSQTYHVREYILVDNCSDDGSTQIAEDYAARFPEKIRLIHTSSFLSQVANFNFALSSISPESKYCKIVQADDWLYPECLERQVDLAESDESVGIVSSYRLKGTRVLGDGLPYTQSILAGRDLCRLQLTTSTFLFGTPTTVLYRSEVVRSVSPFYDERTFYDDSDVCYRILQSWNFGFVHQILSFSRVDDDSIRGRILHFGPDLLDTFLQLTKFGPIYLQPDELRPTLSKTTAAYYRFLARSRLAGRNNAFWQFHISGLSSVGLSIRKQLLLKHLFLELLRLLANPGLTVSTLYHRLRSRKPENGSRYASLPNVPD
jgi:glycosyltransferase involved in cell wall biosynthesis